MLSAFYAFYAVGSLRVLLLCRRLICRVLAILPCRNMKRHFLSASTETCGALLCCRLFFAFFAFLPSARSEFCLFAVGLFAAFLQFYLAVT